MKSIKNHAMFILPLLAILLGIESFLAFGRVTASYGERLKQEYAILVVANAPMDLKTFQAIDASIERIEPVEKKEIIERISRGISNTTTEEILEALPQFYTLHLDRYPDIGQMDQIKAALEADTRIRQVEMFLQAHKAQYNLFVLIKITLWVFVGLLVLTSLFLVLKQMEIWHFEHRERMQVMEILGASAMLRSGVLFRIALIDAIIATSLTIGLFVFLRFFWLPKSTITLLSGKETLVFFWSDTAILAGTALAIVLTSVVVVVRGAREIPEA